ncbi:ArsR/SmtB family transcription factor [Agromyces sp. SYSU T0242]|uniref:ArsR/SmtB family transcription factor n=1 Tax=Agromyces litoreus TaxID=3158561 RepID=UPI003390DC22
MSSTTRLDEAFAALANPTRRAIVARLAQGEAAVGELAEPFDLSLPAISKHIKVLEQAGLVTRARYAQFRPCALNAEMLDEITDWATHTRAVWTARLDRMDDYLAHLRSAKEGERE